MSTELPVRVSFRKQVSDGQYGTEAAEVTLEALVDPDLEGVEDVARMLLEDARTRVHAELLNSPSPAVRRSLVRVEARQEAGVR
jgi:hypothetical protein